MSYIHDIISAIKLPTNIIYDICDKEAIHKITSTDNAILRFDGTEGNIQDSLIKILDTGSLVIGGTWTGTSSQNPYLQLGDSITASQNARLTANNTGAFTFAPSSTPTFLATTTEFRPISNTAGSIDLGSASYKFRNIYATTGIYAATAYISKINNGANITIPTSSGVMALVSDLPTAASTTNAGIVQLSNTGISHNQTRAITAGWAYDKEKTISAVTDTANEAYEIITQKTRLYVDELPEIPSPLLINKTFAKNAIFCVLNSSSTSDVYDTYICIANQREINNIAYILESNPTLVQNPTHNIVNIWLKEHDTTWSQSASFWLPGKLHFYSNYDDEAEEWIELDNSPLIGSTTGASTEDLAALCAELNTLDYFYVDTEPNKGETDCDVAFTYNFNSYWQQINGSYTQEEAHYFGYGGLIGSASTTLNSTITPNDNLIDRIGAASATKVYPSIGDFLIGTNGGIVKRIAGSGAAANGDYVFWGMTKWTNDNQFGKGEIKEIPIAPWPMMSPGIISLSAPTGSSSLIYFSHSISGLKQRKIAIDYGLSFYPISTSNTSYSHFYPITTTSNSVFLPAGTFNIEDNLYLKGTISNNLFIVDSTTSAIVSNNLTDQIADNNTVYWNYGRITNKSSSNYTLELYEGKMWQVISVNSTNKVIPYTGLNEILNALNANGVSY